jgi:PAS domain S-box-containing protein
LLQVLFVMVYRDNSRMLTPDPSIGCGYDSPQKALLDSIDIALLIVQRESGVICSANTKACELLGLAMEELTGKYWSDWTTGKPPYTRENLQLVLEAGEKEPAVEWQIISAAGRPLWTEMSCRHAELPDGPCYVISLRDISKRKRTEKMLRRSEEHLRVLLGTTRDPLYCLSLPELKYEYVSPMMEQVLGYSVEKIIEEGWLGFMQHVHGDDVAALRRSLDQFWRNREMLQKPSVPETMVHEFRLNHGAKGWRWLSDHRSLVRDENGATVAIIGYLRDVTVQRQHAEELDQKPLPELEEASIATQVALLECDAKGKITSWSCQAERLFGWSEGKMLGKSLATSGLIYVEDWVRVETALQCLLNRSEARTSCVARAVCQDGRVIVCEWHHSGLLNPEGGVGAILSLITDISLEKKFQEALRILAEDSMAASTGPDFCRGMCLHLARLLEVSGAQVITPVPQRDRTVTTIGNVMHNRLESDVSFSLVGRPCYQVFNGEVVMYQDHVAEQFTMDPFLQKQGLRGYLGLPLRTSEGRIIGAIVVFSDEPLAAPDRALSLLRLFGARAAAELVRYQSEQALRQSEERYALVASGTIGGVWDWDIRSGGVYYSPRFMDLLGYAPHEFPGHISAWQEKIAPEQLEAVSQAFEDHLENRHPFIMELQLLTKEGSYRWFEVSGQATWDEEGNPCRMAGGLDCIEQRKRNDERLRRLNQLYAMSCTIHELIMHERSPLELYEKSVRIAVSEGGMSAAWIGLQDADSDRLRPIAWAGSKIMNLNEVHPILLDPGNMGAPIYRSLETGEVSVYNRLEDTLDPATAKTGAVPQVIPLFHSCAVYPLQPFGSTMGVFVIYSDTIDCFREEENRLIAALAANLSFALENAARDVERETAEEALLDSERIISTLMSNLPGAAFRAQSSADTWRISFISEGCMEFMANEPDELLHQPMIALSEQVHPEDRANVREVIEKALNEGTSYEVTYRYRATDGIERWLWERGRGIEGERGEQGYIEGFTTDVSEKHRLQSQVLRTQRLESIGTLAGGIAHDLNNVLTPILMSLSILRLKLKEPRDQKLLDSMESSANRGADMVKQILGFARGVESQVQRLTASTVLAELDRLLHETFPKSIRLHFDSTAEVPSFDADPTQLQQILLNLCVNARDAMPDGGVLTVTATATTITESLPTINEDASLGDFIIFEVKDTGTGIPAELRERIFDPFFTTKELGKGTGLGLSTTLGIVKSHRGFIDVQSETGHGTSFRIYLPVTMSNKQAPRITSMHLPSGGNNQLILIVDDESAILNAAQNTLEANGYRIITAADGQQGLDTFAQAEEKPVLVITDMMMPRMDGALMARHLRETEPALPIIAMTGYSHHLANEIQQLRLSSVLRKPFTAQQLICAVDQAFKPTNKTNPVDPTAGIVAQS